MKTWKVLELGIEPFETIVLCCPHCGIQAEMPIAKSGSSVIAAIGLGLIFDDASYKPAQPLLPKKIKCRYCKRIYEWDDSKEVADERVVG